MDEKKVCEGHGCGNCCGNNCGKKCGCMHHVITPSIFVILLALAFLLQAFGVLTMSQISIIWPILLILAVLSKMTRRMCKCC